MQDSRAASTRFIVASLLDEYYPRAIRSALLSRESFRTRYGFEVDVQVSFGDTGVSVSRSSLFSCVRTVLSAPDKRPEIKDCDGNAWRVEAVDVAQGKTKLSHGERSLILPDFWMLLQGAEARTLNFDRVSEELNLPAAARTYWFKRLSSEPLLDDEVDQLLDDIRDTPIHVIRRVTSEVEEGQSSFESLVPRSARYFYRLAGDIAMATELGDFVRQGLSVHVSDLIAWNATDGTKLALLLSAHSSVPELMKLTEFNSDELQSVFDYLETSGDRLSQLGAVELGLSILDQHPRLEGAIIRMIEQIRDDDPDSEYSRFRLFSALVVLVEGEVSRAKTLTDQLPFWRRLATIAQASLIERCIFSFPIDVGEFTKWAQAGRGQQFYLQTLCDLRNEPKWLPDFISPDQLKAEFIGRIANAAKSHEESIASQAIRDLTLTDSAGSIMHLLKLPMPFLPGPLEGGTAPKTPLPTDLETAIDDALCQDIIDWKSFVGLINAALIFRLEPRFAELAVQALQRTKHYVKQGTDAGSLFHLFSGLASVAAVTRSPQLAEELRVLIRRSKAAGALDIAADSLLRIGMVAAASNSQLEEWCVYVGEWATELAFSDLSDDEAAKLHSHITCLCSIVPELWTTLGRAEAALSAISKK